MVTSVRGRRWLVRSAQPSVEIGREFPPLIAQALARRGISTSLEAKRFFLGDRPASDPMEIPGVEKAVTRILRAIRDGERIAVYGDYDVDGVTATAILTDAIRGLGGEAFGHIPDRFSDGYGLTPAGLKAVRDRGAGLVVSVDCGINANKEIDYAAEIGLGVIVLDHHSPPPHLPEAEAIVDPKIIGPDGERCPVEYEGLAACGLTFTFVRALYAAAGRSLDEQRYLELAALGTVADMVPLHGENRRIVRDGLRAIKQSRRPGLNALLETAGVDANKIDAENIAFRLAPRINAAGRLDSAYLALELLVTDDDERALDLAATLSDLNTRRQRMTEEACALARRMASEDTGSALVMVGHESMGQGIVGLVAGKLVEELYRPSIVYQRRDDYCSGSVRSIPEFDAVQCLARGDGLMARWGGHSQAGGFTVRTDQVERLKSVLREWADDQLAGMELQPAFEADAEAPLSRLGRADLKWLPYFEPCGQENPTPAFVSRNVPVMSVKTMGADGKHLRMKLKDGPASWDAVAFGMGHAAPRPGTRLDILYSVTPDRRGFGVELHLKDFAPTA
jgi:single-stranded-DNA-specific exonuclease